MQEKPPARDLKVVSIGNSRGVRLPTAVLNKYAITDTVVLEEREEGILLRSRRDERLSWEETYRWPGNAKIGGTWRWRSATA
ncbi:MAG: AbrB/MazE/SpoVT family DNA-binding domain-containing protein [Pseudomonadota bacterium]|nr:AbrB/MazE/SpoVT family DNA-binding domain-containing protein [Gammaproteobacteria bacterium]MDQ3581844.1 AbrB/MazE/SpoVT family DNA-binding domain-containing protein [Pseudomonadota bacterium]